MVRYDHAITAATLDSNVKLHKRTCERVLCNLISAAFLGSCEGCRPLEDITNEQKLALCSMDQGTRIHIRVHCGIGRLHACADHETGMNWWTPCTTLDALKALMLGCHSMGMSRE